MNLYAISDLHLANRANRLALLDLPEYSNDWLILAGDIGETGDQLDSALTILTKKFKQIIWVPGNHDLWTIPLIETELKGKSKYNQLVTICRKYNVLTPEDEYPKITIDNTKYIIAPTFTLYDYSFRPPHIKFKKALEWAEEAGIICTDEGLLFSDPYSSITEWCEYRCNYTESRLSNLPDKTPIILVNHYPLLEEHAELWRIPRFKLWCGTKLTEHWIQRFNIRIVIYGHLHIRSTKIKDDVIFEEVSFGYPRDWDERRGLKRYLRKISYTRPG